MTTDQLTEIEQRHTRAISNNEAALYSHLVEEDMPALIAEARKVEALEAELEELTWLLFPEGLNYWPSLAVAMKARNELAKQSAARAESAEAQNTKLTAYVRQAEDRAAAAEKERDAANEKLRVLVSPAVQGVLSKMAVPMDEQMEAMRQNLIVLDRVKSERDAALAAVERLKGGLETLRENVCPDILLEFDDGNVTVGEVIARTLSQLPAPTGATTKGPSILTADDLDDPRPGCKLDAAPPGSAGQPGESFPGNLKGPKQPTTDELSAMMSKAMDDPGLTDYVNQLHIIIGPNRMCRCGEDGQTCLQKLMEASEEIRDSVLALSMMPSTPPPLAAEPVSAPQGGDDATVETTRLFKVFLNATSPMEYVELLEAGVKRIERDRNEARRAVAERDKELERARGLTDIYGTEVIQLRAELAREREAREKAELARDESGVRADFAELATQKAIRGEIAAMLDALAVEYDTTPNATLEDNLRAMAAKLRQSDAK